MKSIHRSKYYVDTVYMPTHLTIDENSSPFYLARIGHAVGTGQYQNHFRLPYFWALYAIKGEAEISFDSEKFTLKPGDFAIFRPNYTTSFKESSSEPFEYYWMDLHGFTAESTINRALSSNKAVTVFPDMQADLEPFLNENIKIIEDDLQSPFHAEYCAWHLMKKISDKYPVILTKTASNSAVQIKRLIDYGFRHNLSIETIAQKLNMGRSTLFKKFKAEYGISPKKYLDQQKIDFACKLLKESDLPIAEIAFQAGFDSNQHFYLMFRKIKDTTPSKYRSGQ